MKTTRWFKAHEISPGRVGLYECENSPDEFRAMRLWDGHRWQIKIDGRFIETSFGEWTSNRWRGLTTKDGK